MARATRRRVCPGCGGGARRFSPCSPSCPVLGAILEVAGDRVRQAQQERQDRKADRMADRRETVFYSLIGAGSIVALLVIAILEAIGRIH